MTDQIYVIPKLDDKGVLNLFREITEKQRPNGLTVEPTGMRGIDLLNPGDQEHTLKRLDRTGSFLIWRVHANFRGMRLLYTRGGEITSEKRASSVLDEIKVTRHDEPNELSAAERLDILDIVAAKAELAKDAPPLAREAGRSLEELDALYRSTVLRLESSFAEQIEKITSWTVEKAGELQKQEIMLGEETAAKRASLDSEYEALREKLKIREDELEAKKKTLDDRDYMHARRATRADIQKVIAERQAKFTLTPQTRRLRVPIHIALIVIVLVLLALSAVNLQNLVSAFADPRDNLFSFAVVWPLIKQAALSLALIGAIWFYLHWMNRWFEQHASAEFLLKEFQLDVDRASWVVETALEWRRIAESELPEPLLVGITRNLFARNPSQELKPSAADELASALMGNAAGLKLKVGENELSFSRKGLSKLNKTHVSATEE